MKKTLMLYDIMRRCASSDEDSSKRSAISLVIIGVIGAVLLGAAGYACGQFLPLVSQLVPGIDVRLALFMLLFTLAGIAAIFPTLPRILGVMFMSTDIDVLAAMPFSSLQIGIARVMVALPIAYVITLALILPFTVGFCITAGFDAMLLLCAIVAAIIVPLGTMCIVAAILTLVMRFFRGIRNRDLLAVLGVIAVVILIVLFNVVSNSVSGNATSDQAATMISSLARIYDIAWILPYAALCAQALKFGPLCLLGALAIVVVLGALLALVLSKMYLPAALGMVNAKSARKDLDAEGLKRATASRSVEKALFRKERVAYFKDPSYTMSWVIAVIFPALLALPGLLGAGSEGGLGGPLALFAGFVNFNPSICLVAGVFVGLALTFAASAMTSAGTSCISREGENFDFMKTIPVEYAVQLDAKRKTTIIALALPSTTYIVIGGIAGIVFIALPPVLVIGALIANVCSVVLVANLQLRTAARKANVHWDNAQTAVKSTALWMIVGLALFAVFAVLSIVIVIASSMLSPEMLPIVCYAGSAVLLVGIAVAAYLTKQSCLRYAARKLDQLV